MTQYSTVVKKNNNKNPKFIFIGNVMISDRYDEFIFNLSA